MTLYPIEPIVGGRWQREGLWSYIMRLAEHHCVLVGDLIKEIIWPASGWPENKLRAIKGFRELGFLDGAGPVACDWVNVLQKLTGREDLTGLTFLPGARAFRLEGAGRRTGARCIECLREMESRCNACYDPLTWSLTDYAVCSGHSVLLTDVCARCRAKDLAIVRATSRLGCCGKCGVWMGSDIFKSEPATEASRYRIAISDALCDVVSILDDQRLLNVDGTQVLEYAAKIAFDNNFAEMARGIQMPKNTLSNHLSRRTIPRIETVATLSVVTGIPVKHMLLGSLNGRRVVRKAIKQPIAKPDPQLQKTRRAAMDFEAVEVELRRSLRNVRIPSLTKIAEKAGVSPRSLHAHFPELTQQVSAKSRESRRAKSNERTERDCKIFFSAFATLVLAGEFPTSRRLSQILGAGASISQRLFYAEILKRYGLTGMGRSPEPVQSKALLRAREMMIANNLQMTDEV